jgi:hypothetical protein
MKTLVAIVAVVLMGCGLLTSAKFPKDILAEYECVQTQVEAGDTNVANIMAACLIEEEQIVADALSALLSSKKWVAEHPDRVPHARALMTVARTKAAAKAAGAP